LNKWIRARPAGWVSGCACTATGGVSNLTIATAAGVVYQLHTHTFPAFDTGVSDDIYVVNDNTTPYKRVQDLDGHVGTDSEGVAMKSYFNLVVWGVASEAGTDSKLMVNLPAGSYSNDSGSQATNDLQAYSVYTIPSQFVGCGFLIARLTISKSGSTYTIEETHDLRGTFPSTGAGASGGGAGAVEFIDNQFRIKAVADETKKLAFDISGVTTGTTRTITVPDEDFSLVDWTLATEDLYTSGYVRTDHLWLPEQASSPGSAAGNGLLWVKNTAPTTLFFTDDTGVDHDLTAGGGGGLSDVVDDLTPELGGNLDALTKNISNVQDLSADQLIIGGGTLGVETALFKQQTAASSSPTIVIESVNFLGALARLDFENAYSASGTFAIYQDSNGNAHLNNIDAAEDFVITQTGAGTIQFIQNSAEAMRVHTNGYVGINIAAPSAFLHVDNDGGSAVAMIEHSSGMWAWMHFMDSITSTATSVGVGCIGNSIVLKGGANTCLTADATTTIIYDDVRISDGIFRLKEVSGAAADVATWGQIWVKNTATQELWWTDEAGTDAQLVSASESTFTPWLGDVSHSASESQTYTTQDGDYTLIGNMCFFTINLIVSSTGTLSGSIFIEGLPYTAHASKGRWSCTVGDANSLLITASEGVTGVIEEGNDYITMQVWDSTGGCTSMQVGEWSAAGQVVISGCYRIA
jgi:hypothetical protein